MKGAGEETTYRREKKEPNLDFRKLQKLESSPGKKRKCECCGHRIQNVLLKDNSVLGNDSLVNEEQHAPTVPVRIVN